MIGRSAGSTSSSGPDQSFSTVGWASSGSQVRTSASRASRPSSTSIMVSAATIGFVMDAIRNTESRVMAAVPSVSCRPTATTRTSSPSAASATRPGTAPLSTAACMALSSPLTAGTVTMRTSHTRCARPDMRIA